MRRFVLLIALSLFCSPVVAHATLHSRAFDMRDGKLTYQFEQSPRVTVGDVDEGTVQIFWEGLAARDKDTLYFSDDNRWKPDWASLQTTLPLTASYDEVVSKNVWYMWDKNTAMFVHCYNSWDPTMGTTDFCSAEELRGADTSHLREVGRAKAVDGEHSYFGASSVSLQEFSESSWYPKEQVKSSFPDFAPTLPACAGTKRIQLTTSFQVDACGIYSIKGDVRPFVTQPGQEWRALQDTDAAYTNGEVIFLPLKNIEESQGNIMTIRDTATFRVVSPTIAVDDKAIYCLRDDVVLPDWKTKNIQILANGIVLEDGLPACSPYLFESTVGLDGKYVDVDWASYQQLHTGLPIGMDKTGVIVAGKRFAMVGTTLEQLGGWYFQGPAALYRWSDGNSYSYGLYEIGPDDIHHATMIRPDLLWVQEGKWENLLSRNGVPVGYWSGNIADPQHVIPFYDADQMYSTKAKEGIAEKSVYALVKLYEMGLIKGYTNMSLRPDAGINRAEAAMLLYRGLYAGERCDETQNRFKDVASNAWYAEAVCVLAQHGVVKGRDAMHFVPDAPVLYQEMVTMTLRARNFDLPVSSPWYLAAMNMAFALGWTEEDPGSDYVFPADRRDAIWLLANALVLL